MPPRWPGQLPSGWTGRRCRADVMGWDAMRSSGPKTTASRPRDGEQADSYACADSSQPAGPVFIGLGVKDEVEVRIEHGWGLPVGPPVEPEVDGDDREGDEEQVLHADEAEPHEVAAEGGRAGKDPGAAFREAVEPCHGEEQGRDDDKHDPAEDQVVQHRVKVQKAKVGGLQVGPDETGGAGRALIGDEAGDAIGREVTGDGLMDIGVVEWEAVLLVQSADEVKKRQCVKQG